MNSWRARCVDEAHGGFGGRARETARWKRWYRARVRPYTYLTCGEGEMFLCAIHDRHSRTVLGHSVSGHISAEMVTDAMVAAVAARGGGRRGTIPHSDRGGEDTAHLTAQACFRHGLRRSMGATGICWDNSPAGSFWSTFKHEEYHRHVSATKVELVAAVDT